MVESVRLGRDEILREFKCSRRLAARVGALLARKVALSPTLLDEAHPGSAAEKLLLKKELLETDDISVLIQIGNIPEDLRDYFEESPLAIVEDGDWKIIVFEEDLLAESGFEQVPGQDSDTTGKMPLIPTKQKETNLSFANSPASAYGGNEAFSNDEISRLRIRIFAGADSSDKISSLKTFLLSPAPENLKRSVFLQALADECPELRQAAAKGIGHLGVDRSLSDALLNFLGAGDTETNTSIERLRDLAKSCGEFGLDAIMMAAFGVLQNDNTSDGQSSKGIQLLGELSEQLGAGRLARKDQFKAIIDSVDSKVIGSDSFVRKALGKIIRTDEEYFTAELVNEVRNSNSPAYRGFMLELLFLIDLPESVAKSLLPFAAEVLRGLPETDDAYRQIGVWLARQGEDGIRQIVGMLDDRESAKQRFAIRLLDNSLNSNPYDQETRNLIAGHALDLFKRCQKHVRSEIIETRILARNDISEEIRLAGATAMLNDLREYSRWPLSEVFEASLVNFGAPAWKPALQCLREQKGEREAALLCSALGKIGRLMADSEIPETVVAAGNILRELQKQSFSDLAYRDSLHLALGRISGSRAIPANASKVVVRTLFNRLQGTTDDASTLEAIAIACEGAGAEESDIRKIATLVLSHINSAIPDPTLEVRVENGEDTFVMGGGTKSYSDLLPACIRSLGAIVMSAGCPDDTRSEIISVMIEKWEKSITFELQWGPANATKLTEILGRVGRSDIVHAEDRVRIANTLARRISDYNVLEALSEIISRQDKSPQLDRLGGAVFLRILQKLESEDGITSEDKERLLKILTRIATRGSFEIRGGNTDRLYDRLINAILSAHRQGIPGIFNNLTTLQKSEAIPPAHAEKIAAEISRLSQVSIRR